MYRALILMLKTINIKVFYVFMAICVIPVTMVFSSGARLTYCYYHQRRGYGWWKSVCATYKNHCLFGQTVIDKFAMYAGHKFQIAYHGLEDYNQLLERPDAFIQLSAHIGCSEILGYSLHVDKPCNVLVYGGEKASLMSYRKASFGDMNIRMIPVGMETTHSDEMVEALAETVETILETVHMVLERTPPELVADISENGVVLSGGGSLLYGLDKLVTERTGIPAHVVDDALSCTAYGAGRMLSRLDSMKDGMMNFARRRQLDTGVK